MPNNTRMNSPIKGLANKPKNNVELPHQPNKFNLGILKVGRFATNPVTAAIVLISFGYWLFHHETSNSPIDVFLSACVEFTKGFYAFLSIFGSYRLYKKEKLRGWKILSAAAVFWCSGEMVYGAAILTKKQSELPTSIADWFFLATIPLAIMGVFSVGMYGLKRAEKFRIALDSLAIAGTLAFISLSFLIDTILSRKELLLGDATLQLTFVVLDITFASLAFSMLLYRRFDKMIMPIAVGMIFQALADVLYISDKFKGTLDTRPFTRTLLFTTAILMCFAAQRIDGRPQNNPNQIGDKQLRLGVFATVTVAIVFAIIKLPITPEISPLVAFAFIVLFIVTLVGQITSHYENSKLQHMQEKSLEAMTQSEEKFRIAFENGPTGLVILDASGKIVQANNAFANLISNKPEDLIDTDLITHIHPDDREEHLRESIFAAQNKKVDKYEVRFIEREGSISWGSINVSIMPVTDKRTYIVYQIEDINEKKNSSMKLEYIAVHDTLTGLANRAYFIERLDEELKIVGTTHSTLAVLFIDLDRFKTINDSLGHDVGDQVIQTIAQRISTVVADRGTVARFGGDEFTVLISPPANELLATSIAREILDEVTKPFLLGESESFISASIGVVLTDKNTNDSLALLRDADAAMNKAKDLGRNRIEIADRQGHKVAMTELKTVNDLHRAVTNGEIKAFYQPIYNLETSELSGFEALARWEHPTRGLISPDDFIPLAEETGLIMDIGKHVMLEAFTQLGVWQKIYQQSDGTPLTMSVNLAARQLNSSRLMSDIKEVKKQLKVKKDSMKFEITESAILSETNDVEGLLNDIHDMGFNLIIDDFGTGYSSLSYLKRFPIDGFKIDKSFVLGLNADENDTAIVRSLVGLAHSMHLSVTAEGVETSAVLETLTELGSTYGQGYFFAKPLSADQVNFKVLSTYDPNVSADEKNEDEHNAHPHIIHLNKFKSGS